MAEDSMLWTTSGTGDGPAGGFTQQNWLDMHRYIFSPDVEGTQFILPRKGNKLAPTAGASSVNIDTGAAFVYGFFYKNTASVNVAITTPTLGTTGIRVVLRASWAAQTVRATVIRNSDGVAAVPGATQTPGTTYDVTIATGTITTGGVVTLTDTRAYLQPAFEIAGSMFNANVADGSTIELASNTLRVKDAGITSAKLAAAVAGNGLSGGAGSALAVNVDNSSIEINADTLRVKALGIATSMLALNSVDDTIAGNRVPQFYRRQGAASFPNDWYVQGVTNYTPTSVRMQAGIVSTSLGNPYTVTFPVAFSGTPLVVAVCDNALVICAVTNATASGCALETKLATTGVHSNVNVTWFAVGPE